MNANHFVHSETHTGCSTTDFGHPPGMVHLKFLHRIRHYFIVSFGSCESSTTVAELFFFLE